MIGQNLKCLEDRNAIKSCRCKEEASIRIKMERRDNFQGHASFFHSADRDSHIRPTDLDTAHPSGHYSCRTQYLCVSQALQKKATATVSWHCHSCIPDLILSQLAGREEEQEEEEEERAHSHSLVCLDQYDPPTPTPVFALPMPSFLSLAHCVHYIVSRVVSQV